MADISNLLALKNVFEMLQCKLLQCRIDADVLLEDRIDRNAAHWSIEACTTTTLGLDTFLDTPKKKIVRKRKIQAEMTHIKSRRLKNLLSEKGVLGLIIGLKFGVFADLLRFIGEKLRPAVPPGIRYLD
jgi:hypothetical protein